jgi:hypothetical protein
MIVEWLMHHFGWTDIWYAHPGGSFRRNFSWGGRFHVGVWTGEQHDLICVKKCSTNEEAERLLSPGARTIWLAALRSAWRRLR